MTGTAFGPGSVLAGRFTLEDLLDENDGARFWRATDRTLARSVAVHVLAATDRRADSLLTAARSSALVSDGRLLRVLDAASADGVVYVVNEWGSGVSLDRIIAEGPLSPRRAAWVVREVAEAIATAHRNGVAHGRLLPENVMISESGSVKVIGFVIDAVLRNEPATGAGQRRVTGGDAVSPHESDVLNLAGLLYATLVGRWPGTEGSTIPPAPAEHGRPLRPRQVRAGVPRPLDAICERVLNAGSHPQMLPIGTAHEVYAALSDYIGEPGGATAVGDRAPAFRPGPDEQGPDEQGPDDTGDDTPAAWDVDTGALPATGAYPAPVPAGRADPDPEATQAGVPAFLDAEDDTGDDHPGRPHDPRSLGHPRTLRAPAASARPPEPPPEPPARPLFADDRHATVAAAVPPSWSPGDETGPFTGEQRSTGAGNGRVPAGWGPDSGHSPVDRPASWDDDGRDGVPGRSWLRLAVVLGVVVLLVVAVVVASGLGRGPGTDPTPSRGAGRSASPAPKPSTPVPIAGVTDFDPQGDPPEENSDLAGLAADGRPGTAWRTSTYFDPIGALKSGVGLLVDLGGPKRVGDVRLSLLGSPTSVQVLAAPGADTAPTSTDGLTRVAAAPRAGTRADLTLRRPVTTRWLVVWLTSLPTVPGGFQGRVAEISVRT